MEQKIIIRNNKLLFKFSDHNNNLLYKNYGKVCARSLFLIRSRGSSIKPYFFSCYIFFHRNIEERFMASLTILVWYIHQENYLLYLVIKKKNPYDLTQRKYNNLKEVYAFKFSKETLVS